MTGKSIFRSNRKSLGLVLLLMAVGLVVSFIAYTNFRQYEMSLIAEKVRADSRVLQREVEVLRYVADLLAKNPLFVGLDAQALPRQKMAALIYLKQIQQAESILDAYVLDPTGTCILSSNHSFEGKNYGFRPYFTEAAARGSGSYFAYGVTSKRLGLYLSRRMEQGAAKGGVVVIKVDPLELLVKAGLVAGDDTGTKRQGHLPTNGIVSTSGVLASHDVQGLWVLDNSVLQQDLLKSSRQFDISTLRDIGFAPGTWNHLYNRGFLRVSLREKQCSLYLQPVIPGSFYYFHSFNGNHVGAGIPLLARTMLLLVVSFFLALIPVAVFSLSVERQRARLAEMEEELTLEKRLKDENLERFKTVIEQNRDGFWIMQPDGFVLESVNTTLCTMLGRSSEELVGESPAKLFAAEDIPRIFDRKGILHSEHGRLKVNMRDIEGKNMPVHIDASLMRDNQGKPLFRYAFITDLRQRIKDLEKIRLLEAAVDQSASSIVITDIDGQIRYVNPAFTRVTGYSREEALGQNPRILKSGQQDPEYYSQMWQVVKNGKVWHGRFCNRKKDGSFYWEDAVIAPVRNEDSKISHFVAVKNDVTEKVKIEGQLQDKLAELELIVQHAGAGIAYVKGRKIIGVNEAAAEIIGMPVQQLMLKDTSILFSSSKEYKNFALEHYPELRKGKIVDVEYKTINGRGEDIWVRLTGQAVDRSALDEKGAVWIIQDMTAIHGYQKQLEEARERAEEASRSKSDFLANMSHEIRTPMNAIIGMTRLVQETEMDPIQKKYITRIETSSAMLLGILNSILDFSKIEAGQLLLEEQPFLMETLLDNVYSTMIGLAGDKNLTLVLDLDKNVPEAFVGDAVRLGQILINLVGNGIKFTDQGEINIRISLDAASSTGKNKILHFAVKDTGIGIPEDKQRHLFQSFQQADSSISRRYGGTGLGLAICRQLVQLMGGDINLDSTEGVGSTFSFTIMLPSCAKSEVQQVCQLDATRRNRVSGLSVLLVEDNEANRELGTILLESSGQKVQAAENGLRALELLCEKTFDVILMDVQMPEMDGITATRVIRAMEKGNEPDVQLSAQLLGRLGKKISGNYIPIIAMTAHAMDSDRNRCLDEGMDAYLTKPFQPEQVVEVLQKFTATGDQALSVNDMEIERADKEQDTSSTGEKESIIEAVKHHLTKSYMLNPGQMRQILKTSAASLTANLDKVDRGIKDDDCEAIRAAAHAVKGNLLNLGLVRPAGVAKQMELGAAKNEYIPYDKYHAELRTILNEIIAQNVGG